MVRIIILLLLFLHLLLSSYFSPFSLIPLRLSPMFSFFFFLLNFFSFYPVFLFLHHHFFLLLLFSTSPSSSCFFPFSFSSSYLLFTTFLSRHSPLLPLLPFPYFLLLLRLFLPVRRLFFVSFLLPPQFHFSIATTSARERPFYLFLNLLLSLPVLPTLSSPLPLLPLPPPPLPLLLLPSGNFTLASCHECARASSSVSSSSFLS